MKQTPLAEFGRIDQTGDPAYFVRFLDAACAQQSFQAYKSHILELLRGATKVLDMGCGTGDDARNMAKQVGPSGLVVGVDNSKAMIDIAVSRGVAPGLEFQIAEGTALPFDAGQFNAAVADRSLMHVPDAQKVLSEMKRVVKPGGKVIVYEVDFETLSIDADDRKLARKVAHSWCDGFRNGWLGRRIPRILAELGLERIGVKPYTLMLTPDLALPLLGASTVERAIGRGELTADEGKAWLTGIDRLQIEDRFFSTLSGYLVWGDVSTSH